ncbi:sirohydrochlorin chelatase [Mycobacterium sp. NPDC048908]|uniref:sirohydrochlorin chelatase n=1 Tax=Mycobacterium sp. NPDC048908 TaxID=3364292 RepID=UPI00371A978F
MSSPARAGAQVLVAHGTRKHQGVAMVGALAQRVSQALGQTVHVSFVDVLGPTPSEVLAGLTRGPVTLVPAFLSRGYHVTSDIPAQVDASGHLDVTVTQALGPGPQLVRVLTDRLIESGWRPCDSVILAAAGTSDPSAQRDLHTMATWLSAVTSSRVELAFAATGTPHVGDAVESLRRRGARRIVVASYLLSEGLFQDRLRDSGADVVTDPLGTHHGLVRLIANRFSRARYPVAA